MSHPAADPATHDRIARFREHFHQSRRALVRELGPEAYDEAQVLYLPADEGDTGPPVVVRDTFPRLAGEGSVPEFLDRLRGQWWSARQGFDASAHGRRVRPVAGLYARYLPEVGFDYSVELWTEGGVMACWRADARGRVQRLAAPEDDGMFHDQTGAFLDVRAGWRWLVDTFRREGRLAVAEVQSGYLIGVRRGIPGDADPASREDPELEEAFAANQGDTYDTLEFLTGPAAAEYPFHAERCWDWLAPEDAAEVRAGRIEPFVVADAGEFLACIEDVCGRRGVAVEWVDPQGDLRVALHREPLRLELGFSYPYLRTLHTGLSFSAGALAFYLPAAEALEAAWELHGGLKKALRGHEVRIEEGTVAVVCPEGSNFPVGRWNLMTLAGRSQRLGRLALAEILQFMGWDARAGTFVARPVRLDACPVCGASAWVGKAVRPAALLGVDPRTLAGVSIGDHLVYYTVECPTHVTPLDASPEHPIPDLEEAYRQGLPVAVIPITATRTLSPAAGGGTLILGMDAGSLILEPARLAAVLHATEQYPGDAVHAYGFFPDALVVSTEPLDPATERRARLAALEAVQPRFPGRAFPLDMVRQLDVGVTPAGQVVVAE